MITEKEILSYLPLDVSRCAPTQEKRHSPRIFNQTTPSLPWDKLWTAQGKRSTFHLLWLNFNSLAAWGWHWLCRDLSLHLYAAIMSESPLFSNLSTELMLRLCQIVTPQGFVAGNLVYEEGKIGTYLLVSLILLICLRHLTSQHTLLYSIQEKKTVELWQLSRGLSRVGFT